MRGPRPAGNLYGLVVEPNDPDPARRYKGIVWHEPEYVPREGYFRYTSPDGIHWTRDSEGPLAISLLGYTMPQTGVGDASIFRWDRLLEKYVCDAESAISAGTSSTASSGKGGNKEAGCASSHRLTGVAFDPVVGAMP